MNSREILLIAGMMVVTFGIRYLLFGLAGRIRLRGWLGRSLDYIPPTVLTALTLPALLLPEGEWDISFENPYLVAGLAATALGIVSKNLLVTIGSGLVVFFAYRLLILV
jgi:branched-subunit amino acid transport protein